MSFLSNLKSKPIKPGINPWELTTNEEMINASKRVKHQFEAELIAAEKSYLQAKKNLDDCYSDTGSTANRIFTYQDELAKSEALMNRIKGLIDSLFPENWESDISA